jgi:hypothetical protein
MRTKSFLLNSVVPHGVSSSRETAVIELIYAFLLKRYDADVYSFSINQVGDDLEEFISKEPHNRVHINLRYSTYPDFEEKTAQERNLIRLEVIHTALLKIAEAYKEIDIQKLDLIKNDIIKNNFYYEFEIKRFPNRKNKDLIAKIILNPQVDKFVFYISIEYKENEIQRMLLYEGQPFLDIVVKFFQNGKWKNENEILITGKANIVEIHVFLKEKRIDFINLTKYENPHMFQLMKADITKEEKERAYNDWHDSLPPEMSKFLRNHTYEI